MESRGQGKWKQHRIDLLTLCEAIAGSDAFVRTGHAEDQVTLLKCNTPASGGTRGELARDLSLHLRRVAYGAPPLSRLHHDGG